MKLSVLALIALLFNGCALLPAVSGIGGYFGSGGISLYKSEKSYGPKCELVLVKVEINVYTNSNFAPNGASAIDPGRKQDHNSTQTTGEKNVTIR